MSQVELLANALDYIEKNLNNDIKTSDIADACFCSKSTLEKLFRCINNISVRDYIIRRRMTKAAQVILNNPNEKLLDIALQFGYNSNESFTRASPLKNQNSSLFKILILILHLSNLILLLKRT